jgi:hypothetical protein
LRLLDEIPELVESDLSRFHGIRYTDRWRFDEQGHRKLTIREINVRLTDLPGDARIVKHYNDGKPRWTDEAYLIADLIHVQTGKAHPARPKPKDGIDKRETPQRARIRRQRIAARRKRQMAAGLRNPVPPT